LLATGIYLWQKQDAGPFPLQPTVMQKAAQAAPGHDGAILTLSNGTQLVLDSLNNGVIATQQGAELVLNKGQLSYKSTSYHPSSAISYNTITTPKGRQFHITLPDGTKVWLNAMSALQYPTTFNGKERTVTCSGEAYFEVAKNAAMPFKVRINDTATVEVLGTAFNVNAYTDESSINTTLLEGSIRINALSSVALSSVILKKGEQARLTGNRLQLQPQPDLQQVLAWKNGTFSFTKATLPVVLRQLSRWYDVEFEYRGQLRDIKYGGEISRNASLATVLQILNKSDIHFRMEGNKIIVTP
jgi:hypothetical protein